MTRYFLGVDIGGTKSHALVADETGRALGFGEGGPGNPMRVGYPHFADLVRDITGRALKSGGVSKEDIAGVGLGIGGYDWPSQRRPILEALGELRLAASSPKYSLVRSA